MAVADGRLVVVLFNGSLDIGVTEAVGDEVGARDDGLGGGEFDGMKIGDEVGWRVV